MKMVDDSWAPTVNNVAKRYRTVIGFVHFVGKNETCVPSVGQK